MDEAAFRELTRVVPPEVFSRAKSDRMAASLASCAEQARPDVVAWPTSTQHVSAILTVCNRHRIPVVPRGGATSLTGSVLNVAGGLALDLTRMNKIVEISPADRTAVVEPGVVYADLTAALGLHGLCFPPDPASSAACTIGGNVATNAGGIRGAKYGTTKDYVLGLEVVLADGRVIHTGARTLKSVSGYDLGRIFVGSEGTLGVITRIILKIVPRSRARATAMACFSTLEQSGQAVAAVFEAGVIPSVLEMMDGVCIDLLIKHRGLDLPQAEAMLLAETDGFSQAEADSQMAAVVEAFISRGAVALRQAGDQTEAEALWQARRTLGPLARQLGLRGMVEDVVVPISRLPEAMRGVAEIAEANHLTILNFGHAGDGNLHSQMMYNPDDPNAAERVEAAGSQILALACRLGGTLSGEHGIGISKAAHMSLEHSPEDLDLMLSLKKTLDPNGILNPGKLGLEGHR